MVTNEKILELYNLIITCFICFGSSENAIPIVRNWLEKNGLEEKPTKQGE